MQKNTQQHSIEVWGHYHTLGFGILCFTGRLRELWSTMKCENCLNTCVRTWHVPSPLHLKRKKIIPVLWKTACPVSPKYCWGWNRLSIGFLFHSFLDLSVSLRDKRGEMMEKCKWNWPSRYLRTALYANKNMQQHSIEVWGHYHTLGFGMLCFTGRLRELWSTMKCENCLNTCVRTWHVPSPLHAKKKHIYIYINIYIYLDMCNMHICICVQQIQDHTASAGKPFVVSAGSLESGFRRGTSTHDMLPHLTGARLSHRRRHLRRNTCHAADTWHVLYVNLSWLKNHNTGTSNTYIYICAVQRIHDIHVQSCAYSCNFTNPSWKTRLLRLLLKGYGGPFSPPNFFISFIKRSIK